MYASIYGKKWNLEEMISDGGISLKSWTNGTEAATPVVLDSVENNCVRLAGFTVENTSYTKLSVVAKGWNGCKIFNDEDFASYKSSLTTNEKKEE